MADPAPEESPAAGQPAAVQAAFQALRGQFLAGLPQRWAEIESAGSSALRQAALHRLAGAAGSYGFATLGAAARRAEQAPDRDADAALEALGQTVRHLLLAQAATVR